MNLFNLSTSVKELSGVGKSRAEKLSKLGINTLEDLVYFFPRAYEKRGDVSLISNAEINTVSSFVLTVSTNVTSAKIRNGLTISKFRAFDDSGSIEVIFFNSSYVKDVFAKGSSFRFYGKLTLSKGKLQLTNPKYESFVEGIPLEDYVPIYPLTEGLSSKQIDKLVKIAINDCLPNIKDPLPDQVIIENSLPSLSFALLNAHFPESETALLKSLSRLAFDEMLLFGIGISVQAKRKKLGEGVRFSPCSMEPLTSSLPYELTESQKKAINDIYKDTVIGEKGNISPMARIIVGDVGCGKTICAIAAMYIAKMSGYQSALMVPTEILARQHFSDVKEIFSPLGIKTDLILGSTPAKQKERIYKEIKNGEIDILIGTHALLSDKIDFSRLGLVITDEQHRFGVNQRAKLKEKSALAHLLVMSATPIPRTLALAIYGDLDISRITEMPKGRQKVDTFVVDESYRERLNNFISRQVMLGGQCYIVCPSIESDGDNDNIFINESISIAPVNTKKLNLKNAIDYCEKLRADLPNFNIEVLHGRMKAAEKDAVMSRFVKGEVDILVSTTVIEVGVNVPNASLMIVENAERFGLSGLHQLRGRVGRGSRKSYCVLVSDINSEKSRARLDVMKSTYDGYQIAEKDLLLRGPGDFFSQNSDNNFRQSGGLSFKFASMCDDSDLFECAFKVAKAIIESDPSLALPEHSLLREKAEKHLMLSLSSIS